MWQYVRLPNILFFSLGVVFFLSLPKCGGGVCHWLSLLEESCANTVTWRINQESYMAFLLNYCSCDAFATFPLNLLSAICCVLSQLNSLERSLISLTGVQEVTDILWEEGAHSQKAPQCLFMWLCRHIACEVYFWCIWLQCFRGDFLVHKWTLQRLNVTFCLGSLHVRKSK